MWILLWVSRVSRIHPVPFWSYYVQQQSKDYSRLARTQESQGYSILLRFCKLLSLVHLQLLRHCHSIDISHSEEHSLEVWLFLSVIFQTLKHIQNMFDFDMTSNPHGYLALFVPKTPSVVWYFITDLIPPKVHGYFTLFESKSAVIFIFVCCLIISFKLCKFTWTLHRVFPSSNLNSYVVFH